MEECTVFSLEARMDKQRNHSGFSNLLRHNEPCGLVLHGCALLHQYELADCYLFITDYDCPYEESTCFTLVNKKLTSTLCRRTLGWMYHSFWLASMTWLDERNFTAVISGTAYEFNIRRFFLPVFLPKLHIVRFFEVDDLN